MKHTLYRFLAAGWKFCMIIVTVLLSFPSGEFVGDIAFAATLIAVAVVLQDTSRGLRWSMSAAAATAFAAMHSMGAGFSVRSGTSPSTFAGVVLMIFGGMLVAHAATADRRNTPVSAGRSPSIRDYQQLGSLRSDARQSEPKSDDWGSESPTPLKPILMACMPDVLVYSLIWLAVSGLGVWFASAP